MIMWIENPKESIVKLLKLLYLLQAEPQQLQVLAKALVLIQIVPSTVGDGEVVKADPSLPRPHQLFGEDYRRNLLQNSVSLIYSFGRLLIQQRNIGFLPTMNWAFFLRHEEI